MTFKEAQSRGVERIRKPVWNDLAYIKMPPKVGEFHGPWCLLVDPICRKAGVATSPQSLLWMEVDDGRDDWEPYVGTVDLEEECMP